MLNLTDHLRRLRVDKYEYVAMKVIVLLQSGKGLLFLLFQLDGCLFLKIFTDTSELRESEKVRGCQEKALQALQTYTLAHYPDAPSKFGELLLRIPELQRTCQVNINKLVVEEDLFFNVYVVHRWERKCLQSNQKMVLNSIYC